MNNSDPPNRNAWVPSSAEDSTLVSSALEEILASAPFRGSRRYPAMLRYIVEKTLANQCTELKERTIGIEVFSRDPAYDTNADPVVRFSAGEIRRRLAQFYQESGTASPVILELPSGTYIPKFHLRQQALDNHAVHEAVPHSPELEALIAEAPHTPAETHHPAPQQKHPLRALLGAAALLVLGLAITAAWFFAGGGFKPQDPVRQVWAPLLKMSDPVLISAGRPHTEAEPPEPPNISIGDHILRPEFRVSIATLDAIANLVGYLKTVKKPFHIHEANSNTLDDLHQQPVVLVTGNNNKWTVLLLKPLRFHFIQQGSFSYIEDAQNPSFRGWSLDFDQPYHQQTMDYAVVARFHSSTTGGPVIAIAGISSNGTEAAGEFVVSPDALAKLAKASPTGTLDGNFEAVLKVEVVDGKTGAATVVASQFW